MNQMKVCSHSSDASRFNEQIFAREKPFTSLRLEIEEIMTAGCFGTNCVNLLQVPAQTYT